jgi:hypothetical protein
MFEVLLVVRLRRTPAQRAAMGNTKPACRILRACGTGLWVWWKYTPNHQPPLPPLSRGSGRATRRPLATSARGWTL